MSDIGIPIEAFELSDEVMEKAKTYMPFLTKSMLIKDYAPKCLKDVVIAESGNIVSIKGEDLIQKSVLLLSTLLTYYLGIEIPTEPIKENPYAVYDYYAGENPVGQLEKYKRNEKYGDKAYAILNDYKEVKRLLDTEIYNLRNAYNDVFTRIEALGKLIPAEEETEVKENE